MTSLTIDVTETTLILDKVFQVYKPKRGYFCNNKNQGKREGASVLLLDLQNFCTKSFIIAVGTYCKKSTKLITLLLLRRPAKIQKYQIG